MLENERKGDGPVEEYFSKLAEQMQPKLDRFLLVEKDGPAGSSDTAAVRDRWNHNACGSCRACGKKHAQLYTLHLMELELL